MSVYRGVFLHLICEYHLERMDCQKEATVQGFLQKDAEDNARAAGWKVSVSKDIALCPRCRSRYGTSRGRQTNA
jgi:hypothetical protein